MMACVRLLALLGYLSRLAEANQALDVSLPGVVAQADDSWPAGYEVHGCSVNAYGTLISAMEQECGGSFGRTQYECNGKPVYRQNDESQSPVLMQGNQHLYQVSGGSRWVISADYEDCDGSGATAQNEACGDKPDDTSCLGEWETGDWWFSDAPDMFVDELTDCDRICCSHPGCDNRDEELCTPGVQQATLIWWPDACHERSASPPPPPPPPSTSSQPQPQPSEPEPEPTAGPSSAVCTAVCGTHSHAVGAAQARGGSCVCNCEDGFGGDYCEQMPEPEPEPEPEPQPVDPVVCSAVCATHPHAIRMAPITMASYGTCRCECEPNYGGDFCDINNAPWASMVQGRGSQV
eukprot:COSAG04_NODE_6195_length_1387_cov_1.777174_1_plen_348_part_10